MKLILFTVCEIIDDMKGKKKYAVVVPLKCTYCNVFGEDFIYMVKCMKKNALHLL